MECAGAPSTLARDLRDLGALERQVIHQTLGIEDEAYDGARDLAGVDGPTDPEGYDRDRTVDADFPSGRAAELIRAWSVMNMMMTERAWTPI